MARIRTLKPEFFRSRSLAACSRDARLTFQGLWCEADDFGRGVADPRILKGAIWPLDDDITWQAVDGHLVELQATGHVRMYEVDGEMFYDIPSWEEHQAAAYRRGKSVHPEAPEQSLHDKSCKEVQAARPSVLELGTGNEELGSTAKPSRKTERDALFDALVEVFGTATTNARKTHYGKCVTELLNAEQSPDEVRVRGRRLLARGWANPSPEALLKWWDNLENEAAPANGTKPEPVRPILGRGVDAEPIWDFDEHGNAVKV